MRKREFPASYPLLGLLALGPATGYDLRKTAEASLAQFWHEGFAQVYASLDYFEAHGLAQEVEQGPNPRKKRVFAITDQGRRVFEDWLERPVESLDFRRHELLVKVFFGRMMDPGCLARHLEAYEAQQRQGRAALEGLARRLEQEESGHPDLPYWLATVEHGVALGRALEGWCRDTKGLVTAKSPKKA